MEFNATTALTAMNNESYGIPLEVQHFRYLGIVIGIIDIIVGSIGNVLTIFVFAKSTTLQSSFNSFVISLAVIDLLTASCMMPFNVAGYVQMDWPEALGGSQSVTTSLQAFFYFNCGYSSIVCLVLITINRFISVKFPKYYKKLFSRRRVILALVLSWLIAPAWLLPFLVGSDGGRRLLGWNRSQILCTFVFLPKNWEAYMQTTRVIFQFAPILIMVTLYSYMTWIVRDSSNDLPWEEAKANDEAHNLVTKTKQAGSALTENEASIAVNMVHSERHETEKRLVFVSLTICIVFVILFIPSLVINILPEGSVKDPRIHMAASNITWFNSCVNPFIYAIVNPKFRVEYKILIKFIWYKISCKF